MKDIFKKENLENLSYKDITNLMLENSKKGMNTLDLFTNIVNILELPKSTIDTKIGDYYTSLTTDKRFVLIDGLWDLRSRHTSDKVIVKLDDDDEEEIESIDEVSDEDDETEDETEESFDSDSNTDDDSFDDTDDGLEDLVVVDEDELGIENN